MKNKNLSVFLISILLFSISCKENEPKPFDIPESAMYFNGMIDKSEKSIVEDQNGYECWVADSCGTITNGIAWFASSSLMQTAPDYYINNRENFTIKFHNLEDTVGTKPDSIMNLYFQQNSMAYAYIDTTIGIDSRYLGAEIIWTDSEGNEYTSLYSVQSENIAFDKYRMDISEIGFTISLESSFSCVLYSKSTKKTISLNEGTSRLYFQSGCL
jgi:hypothetical protein